LTERGKDVFVLSIKYKEPTLFVALPSNRQLEPPIFARIIDEREEQRGGESSRARGQQERGGARSIGSTRPGVYWATRYTAHPRAAVGSLPPHAAGLLPAPPAFSPRSRPSPRAAGQSPAPPCSHQRPPASRPRPPSSHPRHHPSSAVGLLPAPPPFSPCRRPSPAPPASRPRRRPATRARRPSVPVPSVQPSPRPPSSRPRRHLRRRGHDQLAEKGGEEPVESGDGEQRREGMGVASSI
jgi:hypothetical protein